jgi:UDP-N-acetyl-D-mannosaminuronate dehydrogenase
LRHSARRNSTGLPFGLRSDLISRLGEMDAIIICVPTLNEYQSLTLSYIMTRLGHCSICAGQLAVPEHHLPGTTEEVMVPILNRGTSAV